MVSKITKITALAVLVVMPYSTVLSYFSPYETTHSFRDFLVASGVFALISLLLGWFVAGNNFIKSKGFLFFFLGMTVAPPLMLGPPAMGAELLEKTTEEHFRYGLLMLATLLFAAGFYLLLKPVWKSLSLFNKLIIIPFVISMAFMIWDSYSSYCFSDELKSWLASGNKPEDFFQGYNFNELYRTLGRTLVYIVIPWLSCILLLKQQLKKWQMVFLSVFCFAGVVFFILFNFINFKFYFPFMIPAIALAPAYWLGLMLLAKKTTGQA